MWFYLELAIFALGLFIAYRVGWSSGWRSAFDVCYKVIEERKRELRTESLRPKRKVRPSPLSEEEKQPLDD